MAILTDSHGRQAIRRHVPPAEVHALVHKATRGGGTVLLKREVHDDGMVPLRG